MKVLTFVIPAYNSEKFLDKGIPSMLHPEILDKLEIIVVNDGSKDATAETAEKYCAQYPEVVRLISQENKGHGGALNTGCAAAQGKYLKVVDADDWVEMQNLPELIRLLENCDSDVVLTQYHTVNISNGEIKDWLVHAPEFGKKYTFEEIMQDWRNFKWGFTIHGMAYRTAFYQEKANILPEHVFYEDYDYCTFPCCLAESVMPLDLFIYEYRIGDVNQSVSVTNQLKRIGHVETVLKVMLEKYRDLSENAGRKYAAMKIEELFLSYLTTSLLSKPEKKAGRQAAKDQAEKLIQAAPEIFAASKRKFQVFMVLNYLHVSKATWDALMNSGVYKALRK